MTNFGRALSAARGDRDPTPRTSGLQIARRWLPRCECRPWSTFTASGGASGEWGDNERLRLVALHWVLIAWFRLVARVWPFRRAFLFRKAWRPLRRYKVAALRYALIQAKPGERALKSI